MPWKAMGKIRRFNKDDEGATAVEFALVGVPFFITIGAIFEMAVTYAVIMFADFGTEELARKIRTNQITSGSHNEQTFRQELCKMPWMKVFECNKLKVNVQQIAEFGDPAIPRDPNGNLDDTQFGFSPGGRSSINVLRVYYEWPVYLAWTSIQGGDMWSNGHRLIMSNRAFLTEP